MAQQVLSQREIDHIEELLDLVRDKLRDQKTKKRPAIKALDFPYGNLGQRKYFSEDMYSKFIEWCEERGASIEIPPTPNILFQFAEMMSVSDLEALDDVCGNYLIVTLVGEDKARVTWLDLKDRTSDSQISEFEARRDPGSNVHGIYYASLGTVFLLGHIQQTSLSRSFSMTRFSEGRDMIGAVSGASTDKFIFGSACYAHAIETQTFEKFSAAKRTKELGEHPVDVVRHRYSGVVEMLMQYSGVQMSVERPKTSP